MQAPDRAVFQQMLFSKIVPNCKKLGLLDAGDGWLRKRFTELGVIQFEDWADTGEEYLALDEVAKDRERRVASLARVARCDPGVTRAVRGPVPRGERTVSRRRGRRVDRGRRSGVPGSLVGDRSAPSRRGLAR